MNRWFLRVMGGLLLTNAVVMGLAVQSVWSSREKSIQRAGEVALDAAKAEAASIEAQVQRYDLALLQARDVLDDTPDLRSDAGRARVLRQWQRLHARIPTAVPPRATDEAGLIILGAGIGSGGSYADRDYFKSLQKSPVDELVVGQAVLGRTTGQWVFPVVRVRNAAGQPFTGLVTLGVKLLDLGEGFKRHSLGRRGFMSLRAEDVDTLMLRYAPAESVQLLMKKVPLPPAARAGLLTAKTGTPFVGEIVSPTDGVRRQLAGVWVPGVRSFVLAGLAEDELLESWYAEVKRTLGFVVAFGSLSLLLAWLLLRSLNQQRKIAELLEASGQEARVERDFADALFATSPIGLMLVDSGGKVLRANPLAEAVFGYEPHALDGIGIEQLVPPSQRDAHVKWRTALGAETPTQPVDNNRRMGEGRDVQGLKRNGDLVTLEVRLSPVTVAGRGFVVASVVDVGGRVAAAQALRDSEAFMDRVSRTAHVGGWDLDLERQVLRWSDETCRIHELEPGFVPDLTEAIGYYAPEVRGEVEQALQAAMGQAQPWDREWPLITAKGRRVWVRTQGEAECRDGKVIRLFGTFQDITERKQGELERERLHRLLEQSPDFIATTTLDGEVCWHNHGARSMLGLPPEVDLHSLCLRDLQPDWALDHLRRQAVPAVLRGEIWQGDSALLHHDGHTIAVHQVLLAHRDAQGKPEMLLTIIRDRTERERLLSSLETILRDAPVAVIATDTQGLITTFNPAAEAMLGYSAAEMVGVNTPASFHDPVEVTRRAREVSLELKTTIEPGFEVFVARSRLNLPNVYEWTYIRKDGSAVPVMLSVSALRDSTGQITGFMGVALDISTRKAHEQLQRVSLHEKETLLKEVYHRVKNNLQVITSLFNLQLRAMPEGTGRQALMEGADRVRAMALVHEMLYQSKSLASINIANYVKELCANLSSAASAGERGVRIDVSVQPLELGLETSVPLGLMLNELITNSLKHGFVDGEPGRISISLVRLEDGRGRLEVADTGTGFPQSEGGKGKVATLGLKLVATLSRQLDGHLEMLNRGGAVTILTFRLEEPTQPPRL